MARASARDPEPVLVQALVAELAVEALDVGVLRRLAGLDQAQLDAALVGPLVERPARELRPLVGPDRLRQRPEAAIASRTRLTYWPVMP